MTDPAAMFDLCVMTNAKQWTSNVLPARVHPMMIKHLPSIDGVLNTLIIILWYIQLSSANFLSQYFIANSKLLGMLGIQLAIQCSAVWQWLLGQVQQVPISAPSCSTNDYTGFIFQEDKDLLLLEVSQVFECVHVEGSDKLDELFLQASQSYESRETGLFTSSPGSSNGAITSSSHVSTIF